MSATDPAPARRIRRLVGVYDADSTVRGELAYWVGARLGRRHCSLCDITHGSVRAKPEWKECVLGLPVPFDTYHRNDQPDAVRDTLQGVYPAVVAEVDDSHLLLLGPDELDACNGSIDALVDAISAAAARHDLEWTTA